MNITEVRIKSMNAKNEKLKAFASITIDDDFVIRDLKVIEGGKGLFVAMPSRKLSDYCPKCRSKNHLRSKYCNDCGTALGKTKFGRGKIEEDRAEGERGSLHADIAHPVNSECRDNIQLTVVKAFNLSVMEPDKRGIFNSEEIAQAPETLPDSFKTAPKEVEAKEEVAPAAEASSETPETTEAPQASAPVEALAEPVTASIPAAEPVEVEAVISVPAPVAVGTPEVIKQEAPKKESAPQPKAKEAPKAEQKQEGKPKKRRFGLGIFS